MALTIDDLIPTNFKINIQGLELECKPPRLSHILTLNRIGENFKNLDSLNREQIIETEKDFDWVVSELVPDLKDKQLSLQVTLDIIAEILQNVEPEENVELKEKGVKFDSDPKVEKIG